MTEKQALDIASQARSLTSGATVIKVDDHFIIQDYDVLIRVYFNGEILDLTNV